MTEIRKDPILGDEVIVAPDRAARPFDHHDDETSGTNSFCPFCQGNENATPEAIMTVAGDKSSDSWFVRIIPNRYPAVSAASLASSVSDCLEQLPAQGYHEVIIESPSHQITMRELSEDQLLRVVRAWRDRLAVVCTDEVVAHTMIFKNEGTLAGASLEHIHSQLLATSFVPARIDAELDAGYRYFEQTGDLLWTDTLNRELVAGTRVIAENEEFVLLCPFASRFPGEMCLLPREPLPAYETTSEASLPSFAGLLRDALRCLDHAFSGSPLNLAVHTAPPRDPRRAYYHWHLSIIPRLTGIAGFEIGSGSWINIIAPEEAARRYRSALEQHG